jgi:two-component system response regulator YesN
MRIVIADDEPLVRIGLKSSYQWQEAGIEIVGEAADGEETLRLIAEQKPDVVILDIKMPKKDGLAVLEEMKEKGMKAKVIILSGFDDFARVKQAMKLGAVDYFHKPNMNVQEIVSVLQKLQAEARPEPESASELAARGPGKETALRDMLNGSTEAAGQTGLKESNMYVVVFAVKKYTQMLTRYTKENAAFLPSTIRHIVGELLSKEKETEFLQLEPNLFAVFVSHSESNSVQASFTRVNDIVYLIHSSLKRFVNIDSVFGVSDLFHFFRNVKQAVEQAKQALEMKFYHPGDPVFYYRERNGDDGQVQERINAYIAAMKNGLIEEKYDDFAKSLAEWEQFVQSQECMTEKDVKKIYEGLLFIMADGEDRGDDRNRADELDDFEECSAYYHSVFNEKLKARITAKNKEYSPLVRNVIQYIDEHYNENISLKRLGDTFHASPNYISRLFKQEVGRGLFDYINVIRIGKAKELLKDYRYKIYEIAEMVGFNSQVHFAIVFNKYEGMSPKDYRKEIG